MCILNKVRNKNEEEKGERKIEQKRWKVDENGLEKAKGIIKEKVRKKMTVKNFFERLQEKYVRKR